MARSHRHTTISTGHSLRGRCPYVITLQRKNKAYGYFAGERFGAADGQEVTDEIAMNPSHFEERTVSEVLSTLAHEMVHLWQHHCGKPSRSGYHNKQWATKMREIGLIASQTGEPGGKETGQQMTHYIDENGAFAQSCAALIKAGFTIPYIERWQEGSQQKRKQKKASKTRYTCPNCALNAWGKPAIRLMCGECLEVMEAVTDAGDE